MKLATKVQAYFLAQHVSYLEKKQLMRKHCMMVAMAKQHNHNQMMTTPLCGMIAPACEGQCRL